MNYDALLSHCLKKDYAINLIKDEQRRRKELLCGLLYGMSRDELLVLRKTITDLLDKG